MKYLSFLIPQFHLKNLVKKLISYAECVYEDSFFITYRYVAIFVFTKNGYNF